MINWFIILFFSSGNKDMNLTAGGEVLFSAGIGKDFKLYHCKAHGPIQKVVLNFVSKAPAKIKRNTIYAWVTSD